MGFADLSTASAVGVVSLETVAPSTAFVEALHCTVERAVRLDTAAVILRLLHRHRQAHPSSRA